MRSISTAMALLALAAAQGAANAQNTQAPGTIPGLDTLPRPTPTPTPTAVPQLALPVLPSSPASASPPVVLPPVRETLSRPQVTPEAGDVAPASPRARPAPVATATPASVPVASPTPTPTPQPTTEPSPAPIRSPIEVVTRDGAPPASAPFPWLWVWVGAFIACLAVLLVSLGLRRRRRAVVEDEAAQPLTLDEVIGAPPPPPPPAEPVVPPVAPTGAPRARLSIELGAKRAGTNVLSAAVDYRFLITNTGDADALAVAVDLRMLGADDQTNTMLKRLFAAPIGQMTVEPFDLAAGDAVELDGTAMVPRESMPVIDAGGRAMFVPVLSIKLEYSWKGGDGQDTAAFAVGILRDGEKLGAFALDGTPRMWDRVQALEYPV